MSRFHALKDLLDALAEAIQPDEFQDLLSSLKDDALGRSIAKDVNTEGAHVVKLRRLILACGSHDGGLELLWDALDFQVAKTRNVWGRLESSFRMYQGEKCDPSKADPPDLTTCGHHAAKVASTLRERLHVLASQYQALEPMRLQEAITRAMRQAFPGVIAATVFPSVFGQGPIHDWADLLSRTSQDPFALDQRFLQALEEALARVKEEPVPARLASLLVMVLRPPHWPASTECTTYSFRAYFCPDEDAPPDQWLRVDAKVNDQAIHAATWMKDLEPLLKSAISKARTSLVPAHAPLLLEIFLPRLFLNEDMGETIQMQHPMGESEPLIKYYPIVLRSSDRYQYFQEGEHKEIPSQLPVKWKHARQRPCHWWHDPTTTIKKQSPQADERIKNAFDTLEMEPEFFALQRLANLPSCPRLQRKWLDRVIWSTPPVALWWRPQARSTQAERGESVRLFRGERGIPSSTTPSSDHPSDQPDPFNHDTTNPLRLFHAFASEVFKGRRSPKHSRAFRELVLLMDSEERWPPPLVSLPAMERQSDPGGGINVPQDEICYSG